MTSHPFRSEVLCDFPDDVDHVTFPLTPDHIDGHMRLLKAQGVSRISWSYYADERGGQIYPYDPADTRNPFPGWRNIVDTYHLLQNPLRVAAEAAHRHGLEIHGNFKPYETGCGHPFPEGSEEARRFGKLNKPSARLGSLDPFVIEHPELRIKRRTDDIPADNGTRPIASIKLLKHDESPTRIRKENLQFWSSADNYQYQPLDVAFDLEENVEPAERDVENMIGNVYYNHTTLLTRKGDPIRTLTISGLHLPQSYVLITTDFKDGTPDFHNTATEMLRAYDADGNEIVGIFSNGGAIYNGPLVDFRDWGLMFDTGYGCAPAHLDESNDAGNAGLIAFTRGRSDTLDGALCETEPAVQSFWLECVDAILDAGVDGIDFRVENHSTHTDFPFDYGYNPIVLEKLSDPDHPDPKEIARVRGDAYTEFLRNARQRIKDRGKSMRINLQVDYLRPDPPLSRLLAYPANLDLQWRRWIDEGLADEAIFRFVNYQFDEILNAASAQEVVEHCNRYNVPIAFNRYVTHGDLPEEVRQIRGDERFCGFIFYETCCFTEYKPDGTVAMKPDFDVPQAMEIAASERSGMEK
jgi:hypothetical protein